jgi:hypothetical protein
MIGPAIGGRAVTPYIGFVAVLPLIIRAMAACQGGGDQYELDVSGLFHVILPVFVAAFYSRLFHRYIDLIVLWHFHFLFVAIGILPLGLYDTQGGNGVLVDDGLIFVEIYPYFMGRQHDIAGTIGMLDGNGSLDGARPVDRIRFIFFFIVAGCQADQTGDKPYFPCAMHIRYLSCKDTRTAGMTKSKKALRLLEDRRALYQHVYFYLFACF